MKDITRIMVKDFNIKKLGFDMMGYEFDRTNQLSFHHLIIPKAQCIAKNIEADGYLYWNGAILTQDYKGGTDSHDYLHCIERIDRERFDYITKYLQEENIDRRIKYECLLKIHDCLKSFEKEYCSARDGKGKPLIKDAYVRRRIK